MVEIKFGEPKYDINQDVDVYNVGWALSQLKANGIDSLADMKALNSRDKGGDSAKIRLLYKIANREITTFYAMDQVEFNKLLERYGKSLTQDPALPPWHRNVLPTHPKPFWQREPEDDY